LQLGPVSLVRTQRLRGMADLARQAEGVLMRARLGASVLSPESFGADRPRSVVFIRHSYYNFFYLAQALRRRGWDALSVSAEDPKGPSSQFYHGEDLNLFDPDPRRLQQNIGAFYAEVNRRFRMVHFYGRGCMSFFANGYDPFPHYATIPSDFLALREIGVKIGYSISGCLDGVAQSTVHAWSGGACDRCIWQENAAVCTDAGNLAWGQKVYMFCDLIATEGFPALDWQGSDKAYREPLTTALDPEFWRPDLEIPPKWRLSREPGELIVYHGVGNFRERSRGSRNLKGTGAVIDAIERLRSEGVKVRLEFVSDVPNTEVRFIQAQADVIVDQLNNGRYGATAREGMMLGRPTVCHINRSEPPGAQRLESIDSCPLVSANEESVYAVLKDLLSDEAKRHSIGQASRDYALKWHSADACAERFEEVYDRLMLGLSPARSVAVAAAVDGDRGPALAL
jgi:glycosyltransferase involved in cell wall biosynthesis